METKVSNGGDTSDALNTKAKPEKTKPYCVKRIGSCPPCKVLANASSRQQDEPDGPSSSKAVVPNSSSGLKRAEQDVKQVEGSRTNTSSGPTIDHLVQLCDLALASQQTTELVAEELKCKMQHTLTEHEKVQKVAEKSRAEYDELKKPHEGLRSNYNSLREKNKRLISEKVALQQQKSDTRPSAQSSMPGYPVHDSDI